MREEWEHERRKVENQGVSVVGSGSQESGTSMILNGEQKPTSRWREEYARDSDAALVGNDEKSRGDLERGLQPTKAGVAEIANG